ncbi:MAG: 50S ribosomal protein L21 [Deltaproteobacteria bacterium]|nr:50S ribosomal protein L21 [Deltaproteobacteria bacterium]
MFAVIRTGGRQYKVEPGSFVRVNKINGEAGSEITLDDVLLYSNGEEIKIGKPSINGASVSARIVRQGKDRKIIIYKYRRRKDSASKKGHRQLFTELQITGIKA